MSDANDRWMARRASCHVDPDASVHDLLNDATEWLQFARGVTELLADFVHESDVVDCRRMALSLEAVAAMTQVGVQSAAAAHARITLETRAKVEATAPALASPRVAKRRVKPYPED